MRIPFNRPYMTGKEIDNIREAHRNMVLAGNGDFTRLCQDWLVQQTGAQWALLTHSCTAALEMSALLADIAPGDEVIMPSYTFVSTANAFVLRGGVPVFVDIRADTLNLDEHLVEEAVTERTRAIVPVHYAGVACEMDRITAIARAHGLWVIEDAAQGMMASWKDKALGTVGDLGAYSFHETKNIISGEGGALLVNRRENIQRAEVIWEKGTDRSRFIRGEVDRYSWQEVGSSFLPGELIAAFLWGQVGDAENLTRQRLALWQRYHDGLEELEREGRLRRPVIPEGCRHNAHMYYLLLPDRDQRERLRTALQGRGIGALFHYIPLHDSTAGKRFGRVGSTLTQTESAAERVLRLPLWNGMMGSMVDEVVESIRDLI